MEERYVDSTQKPVVTCVEWFHGYGGNALGLKRAIPGLQSVAVCERDAFVVANMVSKMEKGLLDAVPIWTDVTDFPTEPFGYQQLDLFVASYPCQGFSHAGKRLGTEDHRHLWPYCRKFIGAVRPGWVWLENVEGHVTLGLSTVLADLEEDGYTAAWGIFSASEVGAPHQRKRVFILARDASGGRESDHMVNTEVRGNNIYTEQYTGEAPIRGASEELALRNSTGCPHGESEIISTEAGVNAQRDPAASGGEDVAYSTDSGRREDRLPSELRTEVPIQLPGNGGADNGGEGHEVGEGDVWPSRPGQAQYGWEPPRVVPGTNIRPGESWDRFDMGNTTESRPSHEFQARGYNITTGLAGKSSEKENGADIQSFCQTQPPLGGNPNGPANGLDFPRCAGLSGTELEEIYGWMVKGTNRTDELRLCGNGVVPQTAERAFKTLYAELCSGIVAGERRGRVTDTDGRSIEELMGDL